MSMARSPIWQESAHCCYYCGLSLTAQTATRDHVCPHRDGGGRGNNIVLACYVCNRQKG